MEKFSQTIDRTKGFAILLVLLGHINSPFGELIYTFHVPLFFFLSGIFIKTRYSEMENLAKGIERLLVPFLIFGIIGLLIEVAKRLLLHRPFEPIEDSLSGLLYWMDAPHMHHYGFVLWFLPALFWGRMTAYFVVKYFRIYPAILVVFSVMVAWGVAKYTTLPFALDKALVALPWIIMGYVFYQYHERWLSTGWLGIATAGLLAGLFVHFTGLHQLDLATKVIGNLWLAIPYTLLVILFIVGLFYRFSVDNTGVVSRLLTQFGQSSMLVLVLHVYTNNAADVLVNRFLGSGYWFITLCLSVSIVYIAILVKRHYADLFLFKYL